MVKGNKYLVLLGIFYLIFFLHNVYCEEVEETTSMEMLISSICDEVLSATDPVPSDVFEDNQSEDPEENKACSIWCWIQKIVLFIVSELLGDNK